MRRASTILGAVGVVLLIGAALWLLIAPGQLVKYPSDVDKTVAATGTMKLFMDPATGAPLAQPRTLQLSIQRHLRVVASTSSQATVQETSTERAAPLPALQLQQRYVIDRRSMKDVPSSAAYAYTPSNSVDRSPAYSINLPLDSGSGPYNVWKNEAGRAYPFRRSGDSVERDGVTLVPYTGTLENAPATPAYVEQLASQGIPKQLSLAQLTPMLKQQGVDPSALADVVLPVLSRSDRAEVQQLLAKPIPLSYRVSVNTRLLVEPGTGTIVSLDRIGQTFSATANVSGLAGVVTVLSSSRYAGSKVVQGVLAALQKLTTPSPVKVFEVSYGQTPASVADIAAYAKDKASGKTMVESTIPLIAALAGAAALIVGIVLHRRSRVPATV
jgi:hypothetical protein